MRSLGLLPMANSIGVHATQSYLCVSQRRCLAHQLGRCDSVTEWPGPDFGRLYPRVPRETS